MSVSSVIAAEVVSPDKRASAIAVMFTGLTVATVTGVPLGTFIGQQTSWHMTFLLLLSLEPSVYSPIYCSFQKISQYQELSI